LFDSHRSPKAHSSRSHIRSVLGRWPAWLLAALVAALGFYCFNAVHFAKEPLRIEEDEWPPMAKAIYETGKPVIPFDKTHLIRLDSDLRVERESLIGAWHPPLYLYTLGVSMAVLGTHSPYRLRLVGVAGFLLGLVLVFLIAREISSRWRIVGGVAAVLGLIHTFSIQGSTFLDIDPTVYTPLALLVIWLAIRYGKQKQALSALQVLAIGGSIALVTWAKMTTTIDLLGVLVLWWLLARRPFRRALAEAVAFVAVGMALFFSTYGLWCAVTDIPFSYTFQVTFVDKSNRLLSEWRVVGHAAHWHLRWFGAAVLLLALVYLVDLIRSFVATRQLRLMDLPFLLGAAILVQYVVLSPTDGTYQGKYAFPALLMLLLPISWMLLRHPVVPRDPLKWVLAAAIGLAAALLVPDVLTGLSYMGNYGSWTFELRVAAGTAAALLVAWWLGGDRGFAGGLLIVMAALFLSQAIHSYRADTSPMYPIPDTADFNAAVNDLHENLGKGDVVVAAKDIGFYIEGPVIQGEDAFARGDGLLARAIRHYPEITAFARDSFGPPVGPKTEAVLDECFQDRREFGTASVVYRTKRCAQS
jgi:hypothetical protein